MTNPYKQLVKVSENVKQDTQLDEDLKLCAENTVRSEASMMDFLLCTE
jgi:hypothetical protein